MSPWPFLASLLAFDGLLLWSSCTMLPFLGLFLLLFDSRTPSLMVPEMMLLLLMALLFNTCVGLDALMKLALFLCHRKVGDQDWDFASSSSITAWEAVTKASLGKFSTSSFHVDCQQHRINQPLVTIPARPISTYNVFVDGWCVLRIMNSVSIGVAQEVVSLGLTGSSVAEKGNLA